MKSCWGRLGQMFILLHFTQHVSVVLLVEQHEKLCFIVPSFEAGTILLSKVLSFYKMEHLRWLLCNWLWNICTILKLLVVGIKVSLPL